ncbi:MAG TPA: hypothetical protein VGH84_04310 [Steroidobacteraceae bacterium]|jgi:hypothetical protein
MGIGAAVAGSAVLSAGTSLLGSSQASSASTKAANEQLSMYNQTRSDLSPYNTAGQSATTSALSLAQGSPTGGGPDYVSQAAANMPGTMSQSELEQTPGYQFNLSQGLKATQSAAAARGLGVSGSSLKGAATYATNLADSTYQNQFNNAQTRFTDYTNLNTAQQTNLSNQFSRLNSLSTTGENAAAATGVQGTAAASNYGNYTNQAGTATAAGTAGVGSAATNATNSLVSYNALSNYLKNNSNSGGSGMTTNSLDFSGYAPSLTPGQQYTGGFVAPTSGSTG